jgi:hypothetical protein
VQPPRGREITPDGGHDVAQPVRIDLPKDGDKERHSPPDLPASASG